LSIVGFTVAGAVLFTGAALAYTSMTISLDNSAKLVSQSEAEVSLTVSCDAIENQTSGSVDVSLAQQSGSKTTSATGSTAIVCDGQLHSYVVPVIATGGRWHNGDATVSATGQASGTRTITVCSSDRDGNVECSTGTVNQYDRGSAGPQAITLENG
jgi:hypothetical protein